jgi:DNA polymerase III alpha subunit
MTAVINNFGGFYNTRVYVNEARKAGATIHLPCVNNSGYATTIRGADIYLGFIHIQSLEQYYAEKIPSERKKGAFTGLENFIARMGIGLEQAELLIRTGALRFTGKNKKTLLWEALSLLNKGSRQETGALLFTRDTKQFSLPAFNNSRVEDAYDELELLGFTVTATEFDLLKTAFRGGLSASDLIHHTGRQIRILGNFVAVKYVRTVKKEIMNFGTFTDLSGNFFDTVHFPTCLKQYPFKGSGIYLILGRVVEEFGFPSIEVEKMAKLPIQGDPRSE